MSCYSDNDTTERCKKSMVQFACVVGLFWFLYGVPQADEFGFPFGFIADSARVAIVCICIFIYWTLSYLVDRRAGRFVRLLASCALAVITLVCVEIVLFWIRMFCFVL